MKYRKKPAVVEAMQLTNENLLEVKEWCNGELVPNTETREYDLCISNLEGITQANYGDYIIKGTDDEFYLRKAYIFEKIYEIVNQIPQLNDNQKIVLEWLRCSVKEQGNSPIDAIFLLRTGEALDSVLLSLMELNDPQQAEVLAAFAQWGLGQEEAE
ncbi:hypothetical protein A5804_001959 [Enterococcus faecium]|uniref:Phage protein n=1 Tax=Enterococcus faecium TaxID=1352 RepID=A0AB73P4J0_ENTFC|nr:hypothetical protein [Enterococcus faecium]OTO00449.1 hypothetical protein A5804_001959 [Enterococcus faecium]